MVSCKTTTYGRVSTLEETLFSFINQDNLGDSEMIIINDYPLQTLIFDHPNVKIFNLKETFKTIGEKDNFAIEQMSGDIIATMDDDDIYLSNHIDNIRKYFIPGTNMLHWKGIFYNYPDITAITGIGNSGMVYSKEAWLKVGKHPIMNAGGDSVFSKEVHKLDGIVNANLPDNEVSAFYRWSLPQDKIYHQSGLGNDQENKPNIIERHSSHIEKLRKQGFIPTGEIILKPKWKEDYKQLLNNYTIGTPRASKLF